MSSKVYFTDFRCPPGTNQLKKLQKLIRAAGFDSLEMEKKLVAIKMHFGEPGNLAFLRPNYAKAVADLIGERFPNVHDIETFYIGTTIGAHTGPGTVALFFWGTERGE